MLLQAQQPLPCWNGLSDLSRTPAAGKKVWFAASKKAQSDKAHSVQSQTISEHSPGRKTGVPAQRYLEFDTVYFDCCCRDY